MSDFATGAGTFSFLNKLKWQQLGRLRRAAIDSSDQCQKPQSESPRRRRYKASERSAQQLSQELGVSVWSLKRWSKEFSIGGPTGPGALRLSEPASALEITQLRRELEFITRQRDILKKVLGSLGQDPWNSSK